MIQNLFRKLLGLPSWAFWVVIILLTGLGVLSSFIWVIAVSFSLIIIYYLIKFGE